MWLREFSNEYITRYRYLLIIVCCELAKTTFTSQNNNKNKFGAINKVENLESKYAQCTELQKFTKLRLFSRKCTKV